MVDAVSTITFDLGFSGNATTTGANSQVSTFDVARFENFYQGDSSVSSAATAPVSSVETAGGFQSALKVLDLLNTRVDTLGMEAMSSAASLRDLTPGEMLQMSMQAHHFLFQSELTANVANRSSEGIQQLFRQQS